MDFKKGSRLYLFLVFILILVIVGILAVIFHLIRELIELQHLSSYNLNLILGIISMPFIVFLCWNLIAFMQILFLHINNKFYFNFFKKITVSFFLFYYPFIKIIGRLFGIKKDTIRKSFVKIHYLMTDMLVNKKIEVKKVLILLPHCLQLQSCMIRLTYDINYCSECGGCDIARIKQLANKYNINTVIATGGTIARQIIKEKKPELIIAVACERDLVSGIRDVFPMPVVGLLNERPNGPCVSTRLDIESLEFTIKKYLEIE